MNVNELPQYKCHKVVRAGKISEVDIITEPDLTGEGRPEPVQGAFLTFDNYPPVTVDADFVSRHQPQVGGYLVAYEDGYLSYSPAEAFEAGYSAFDPEVERFHADTNRRAAKLINEIMSRDTDKSEGQQCGDDEETPEDEGQEGFASFSAALTWLKEGRKVARSSWPDDKYVCLYTSQTTTHGGVVREQILKAHGANYGANFNGKWIATSEDLLATDWMVVTRYRSGI